MIFFKEIKTKKKLPIVYQAEESECGLACLAMLAQYHNYNIDLYSLRKKTNITLNGLTLNGLNNAAMNIGFNSRPIRMEINDFNLVKLPIILHWNFNHFVVLNKITKNKYIIHDPATGVVKLSEKEFRNCFTGIAIELFPGSNFEQKEEKQKITLTTLIGTINGIKPIIIKIISIAILLELLTIAIPFYGQWVIDNIIPNSDKKLLLALSSVFFIIYIMNEITKAIRSWYILYANSQANIQWSTNIFVKLLKLPTSFFEKRHSGDVISKFKSFHHIQNTISDAFLNAAIDGIMAIGMLILMIIYSQTLASITIITTFLYILIRVVFIYPLKKSTEKLIISVVKSDGYFLDTIRGIRSIKLNNMVSNRCSSWFNLTIENSNAEIRTKSIKIAYDLSSGIVFGIQSILIMAIGATKVIDIEISTGMLMAFIIYSNQFTGRVCSLIEMAISIKMLEVHCERLADIVLNESEEKDDIAKIKFKNTDTTIQVHNLSFRYTDNDDYILKNINFEVKNGESVAVIGPSGSGKSTLLKILVGILKPTSGNIYIGGVDISKIKINELRKIAAVVMQDDQLLSGSIKENINLFSTDYDENKLIDVCKISGIHDQISKMPMQYHTLIGDMGTTLSGGQKQRILLARALYQNPLILFLDEATSNLDVASESHVNESIKNMNITRLIIAHRPETIKSADRVINISMQNQQKAEGLANV